MVVRVAGGIRSCCSTARTCSGPSSHWQICVHLTVCCFCLYLVIHNTAFCCFKPTPQLPKQEIYSPRASTLSSVAHFGKTGEFHCPSTESLEPHGSPNLSLHQMIVVHVTCKFEEWRNSFTCGWQLEAPHHWHMLTNPATYLPVSTT